MPTQERKWYPSHIESVAVNIECCSGKDLGDRVGGGAQVECSCGKCSNVCDNVGEDEVSVCEQSDVSVGPENVVTWSDVGEIDPERLWVRGERVSDADDSVVLKG